MALWLSFKSLVRQKLLLKSRLPYISPRFICKGRRCEARANLATQGMDTIAAIVTGVQQSAVAIVRVSGDYSLDIGRKVFRPSSQQINGAQWQLQSHKVEYGYALDQNGVVIDEVLLLAFKQPRSFTKENTIELQCHGGSVCAQRILQAVLSSGARLAYPGEFTQRAFLNGRLDLSQAESIQELISAQTKQAADSALAGLQGGIKNFVSETRQGVIELLTETEARLDFEDEIGEINKQWLQQKVKELDTLIEQALATAERGQLLRQGVKVVLVGRPNVGKSSLLNLLSSCDRAIVTDVPGTTRDVVESRVLVNGLNINLLDTAGLRQPGDKVEQIGQERTLQAVSQADVIVFVMDVKDGWGSEDGQIFEQLLETVSSEIPLILAANKSDTTDDSCINQDFPENQFHCIVQTSAVTQQGVDDLRQAIFHATSATDQSGGDKLWCVNERQEQALVRTQAALRSAYDSIAADFPLDCVTVDLREAVTALGEVTGDEVTEEILDNIFSKFCIGK